MESPRYKAGNGNRVVDVTRAKIYTREGDDGTTGLFYGGRVPKDSELPRAYGAVDEAQSVIGMARAEAGELELPPQHVQGSAVLVSLRRMPRLFARLGLELPPVMCLTRGVLLSSAMCDVQDKT